MKTYYFGCVGSPGHHYFSVDLGYAPWPEQIDLEKALGRIDGAYCPKGPQVEGRALLHYVNGWTLVSFWDRSVDKRGGCNSNFILEGTLTAAEALEAAKAAFPRIWQRYTFPVVVTNTEPASSGVGLA